VSWKSCVLISNFANILPKISHKPQQAYYTSVRDEGLCELFFMTFYTFYTICWVQWQRLQIEWDYKKKKRASCLVVQRTCWKTKRLCMGSTSLTNVVLQGAHVTQIAHVMALQCRQNNLADQRRGPCVTHELNVLWRRLIPRVATRSPQHRGPWLGNGNAGLFFLHNPFGWCWENRHRVFLFYVE
jgi:hypothetical protein